MPKITEERRKEYVKILKQYAENGRISIRGARQDANNKIKEAEKNKEISEDNANRLKDQVQKLTDRFVKDIDKLSEEKEKEILKV
jgi:ribosome recycling factor